MKEESSTEENLEGEAKDCVEENSKDEKKDCVMGNSTKENPKGETRYWV
jgi:hypothetical protein